jgi:hypothetical protein
MSSEIDLEKVNASLKKRMYLFLWMLMIFF